MKPISDRFSKNSGDYKRYRPNYPKDFLEEIISLTEEKNQCWDCGTGNGQVALELANHFTKVYATDISENQISKALEKDNIEYQITRAEETNFKAASFDLITVAQAIHWFDLNNFYKEVRRVGKKNGILAVWGYGLVRFGNSIDQSIDHFYHEVVGPYWDKERKHIDNSYDDISFPFEEIELSKSYHINMEFTLEEFGGYLSTWSAVKRFKDAMDYDPVQPFIKNITEEWLQLGVKLSANFPLFAKIGRVK